MDKDQTPLKRAVLDRRAFFEYGFASLAVLAQTKPVFSQSGTNTGKHHFLSRDRANIHNRWNNALPPVLAISSGDTVTIETRDAVDGHFTINSTSADIATRDSLKVHPLTGPIYVRKARPGDVLKIDILKYELSDWGWTLFAKGAGLLSEHFEKEYLKIWKFDKEKQTTQLKKGIAVKLKPFSGVMGVAWDEPGEFRTLPPRKNGGNMDIQYLTEGSTLYLPVFVPGALFSAGDGHAAQGDGEVCITAIETELTVTVRISLLKGLLIEEPHYETGSFIATTGVATTMIEAAKKATLYMIRHLAMSYNLSLDEAYVLCSAAMDLKICSAAGLPNYLVSAHFSKDIIREG